MSMGSSLRQKTVFSRPLHAKITTVGRTVSTSSNLVLQIFNEHRYFVKPGVAVRKLEQPIDELTNKLQVISPVDTKRIPVNHLIKAPENPGWKQLPSMQLAIDAISSEVMPRIPNPLNALVLMVSAASRHTRLKMPSSGCYTIGCSCRCFRLAERLLSRPCPMLLRYLIPAFANSFLVVSLRKSRLISLSS